MSDPRATAAAIEKIRNSQSGIVLWNGEDAEKVQRENPFRQVIKINWVKAGDPVGPGDDERTQ